MTLSNANLELLESQGFRVNSKHRIINDTIETPLSSPPPPPLHSLAHLPTTPIPYHMPIGPLGWSVDAPEGVGGGGEESA